ncbi:hypothetical protein [Anaeromassilibacillus sp. SJQ-1]|uniref:hypothetical protein n=1 Tax=Anaeromassilibacillus sp. SJQ-1 TaxID=3375419 RepID=UPI003989AC92
MKIKCRNFEGEILLLAANTEEYYLCQEPRTVVSSYDLKFVQEKLLKFAVFFHLILKS